MQKYLVATASPDVAGTVQVAFEEALTKKFGDARIEITNKPYANIIACTRDSGCDVAALVKEGPKYFVVTRCRRFSQKRFPCIDGGSLEPDDLGRLIAAKAKVALQLHDDDHAKKEDR